MFDFFFLQNFQIFEIFEIKKNLEIFELIFSNVMMKNFHVRFVSAFGQGPGSNDFWGEANGTGVFLLHEP